MKAEYALKMIYVGDNPTHEEYWCRVQKASVIPCKGIDELREAVGGSLHRNRAGYSGVRGNIEYVAVRTK